MIINIASPSRFHVLDLARELNRCGHDVNFYSYVPNKRAIKYGLPSECSKSLFTILLPFLILLKLFPNSNRIKMLLKMIQDYTMGYIMRPCDVFISMTGFTYAPKCAKRKGAIIIFERGSKHILEQKRILDANPNVKGKSPVPELNVKLNIEAYLLADYISIASNHVKQSFLSYNYPAEKLFMNPYGVDLEQFFEDKGCEKQYDIIMVGGWSYRKGCDILKSACSKLNLKLLHVGAIVDIDFPEDDSFTHVDSVDQIELVNYYNKAKVFVLPSREEGMAMVQMQAIACSLPVVCSKDTGGKDIADVTGLGEWIFEMRSYSVDELCIEIQKALDFKKYNKELTIEKKKLENLSWRAYGLRYNEFINSLN